LPKSVRDTGGKNPRVVEIRPLGCREWRAPTWRKSNEPLCRPPAPAGSANRRVDQFHRLFMYSCFRACPASAGDV